MVSLQVKYAIYEYACTAVDVLARRTRLAVLNSHAAEEALPRILEIMQQELNWNDERVMKERHEAKEFLDSEMGIMVS